MTSPIATDLAAAFEVHRAFLWSLCYRMTGSAADAEDVVQDTFLRALERPPARTDEPWRPWLVTVALNLARDLLRRRRRRPYQGPWLPSPIETREEPPSFEPSDPAGSPAARYDLLESVSLAFLLALEALTPAQRAVLLLRDAFDYSVRETASALGMSEANVKTTHGRARGAMAAYDRRRRPPDRKRQRRTREALERLLGCLAKGDVAGVEALLAEGVRSLSDSSGEFPAAKRPIVGREKVARLYLGLAQRGGVGARIQLRVLNGLPAAVLELPGAAAGWARRAVLQCRVDDHGRIEEICTVLASAKLIAVAPASSSEDRP